MQTMPNIMIWQTKRLVWAPLALAVSLALSGCLEPAAPATPPTAETAGRFLGHTTFGATEADINRLVSLGYEEWLNEQFQAQPIDSHYQYIRRGGPPDCYYCDSADLGAAIESFWYQAITGKDQLRQRVSLALLELFVVSAATDSTFQVEPLALAAYLDLLAKNAFGNYRDVLEAVTLSPTMGHYLSHLQNDKQDPATQRLPDENYAREVMQLFTVGKWQLNANGTRMKDANGADIPTYSQSDVMGLAKVLTGWSWGGDDTSEARWVGGPVQNMMTHTWHLPMQQFANHYDPSEKRILNGVVIPAGTPAKEALKIALDTLFQHPNTGPFVAKHLIKRLVTSNPSPEYVNRVAAIFASNKDGVRGDMRSVVRAVLFDPEVWDGAHLSKAQWGKPREPIVKVASLMRALQCKPQSGYYRLGTLQNDEYDIGQPPLMSNSVFNFFQPDFSPNGELAEASLSAPEYQITNNNTLVGYLNVVHSVLDFGLYTNDDTIKCSYAGYTSLAQDPVQLARKLSAVFTGSQLTPATEKMVSDAVATIAPSNATALQNRVKAATMLIMASPDFNVQR